MSIAIEHVSYTYMAGGPYETAALKDVSLTIGDGEFVALIGHTGSGKSTLAQHLNGLLSPTRGRVLVDGVDLNEKGADRRAVRLRVGLVFQYAENQLFEETVAKDVGFGPKNLGLSPEEVEARVKQAMELMSLPYEKYRNRSVFELSGGQTRRAAIAGILAMEPSVLVLDEPCAGLDPKGRQELLALIRRLHSESHKTIIMVSHSMDDVANLAERVIVMDHGTIAMDGTPREVFSQAEALSALGLDVPEMSRLAEALRQRGFAIPRGAYRAEEVKAAILSAFGKEEGHAG